MQASVDVADLDRPIAQNDLLAVPRVSHHSHFAVRLALNDDRAAIGRRQAIENFFEVLWSHSTSGRWHIHCAIELPSHLDAVALEKLIRKCWAKVELGYGWSWALFRCRFNPVADWASSGA
jgi:hypothetical protein